MDTSTPLRPPCRPRPALRITATAATCLALAYGVARTLDSVVDLANLAMVFVLASTLVAFWLPVWASALFTVAGVGLFNWAFVPPRGSFSVEGHQNLLLLGTLLGVSLSIGLLMGRLRQQAALARRRTEEAHQLQHLGDALRAADDPQTMGAALHATLQAMTGDGAALMVLQGERPAMDLPDAAWWWGTPDADETPGLWLCLREGRTFGAGTGLHGELPAWYLPVRGPQLDTATTAIWGAAVLRLDPHGDTSEGDGHTHVQALCDLLGGALHRRHLTRRTEQAQREAQAQSLRSALLAAISHDFRTPLASILGAASALEHQADRLPEARRQALLTQIQDETRALTAMADNTLQLVRLEAGEVELRRDWESLEELIGAVLARVRRRDPQRRVRARLAPDLPLVRVDALLVTQLLENLVDNALKYTEGPVELLARRVEHELLLAVRDRGAGIAPSERERIFQMFQRGADTGSRRGTGLGLAVCRAIAEAHGGVLRVRARGHGGSSFELRLPLPDAPTLAEPAPENSPS
ncbi:ATP-binding protein [Sphaerotilus sp.]|uniref:ATP-binding protein n=1 Tax=Sphaerotilus sp. TaxID=2093942 RepID=UPI00286DC164|nr:ATP-binding protein [Sphaerotilus sp.]